MKTLKQLFSDNKFRIGLYVVFVASIVFAFVFSVYVIYINIESVNDKYREAITRNQRLHGEPTSHYRQDIVDGR